MGGPSSHKKTVDLPEGTVIPLCAHDRLLVLAPHPDDETLATGGLMQQAVSAGAELRAAFITAGENNAWAQRAIEVRLFISAADRERFGERRRREVAAALDRLGIPGRCATFLGFPDQSLTSQLLADGEPLVGKLAALLTTFAPTVIAYPSVLDRHPDHSALAVATRLALARWRAAAAPVELCYVVHTPALRGRSVGGNSVRLDARQRAGKRAAILSHGSQLVWRRAWMLSFAAQTEFFLPPRLALSDSGGPVSAVTRSGDDIELSLVSISRPLSFGSRTLLVGVERGVDSFEVFGCALRRGRERLSLQRPSGVPAGFEAGFHGTPHRGVVRLPGGLLAGAGRLFVKLERRYGFFDEAGWLEIALPQTGDV